MSVLPPSVAKLRHTVVGGGIVGIATARELLTRGAKHVTLLEAEPSLAIHQTARNSGVVHAGLYYAPNSLKATLCREGLQKSLSYFRRRNIPFKACGKLVVAIDQSEVAALKRVFHNALQNNVPDIAFLETASDVRSVEPMCAGVAAIHSPHTAIVDWRAVALQMADDVRSLGGTILTNARAVALAQSSPSELVIRVHHPRSKSSTTLASHRVITCGGVNSDRLSHALGGAKTPSIIPIRGEYLQVTNPAIVNALQTNIYPVPQSGKGSPFLGVHFTPTMEGELIVGPNAVPAFSRTAHSWRTFSFKDTAAMLSAPGFFRLTKNYTSFAVREVYKSLVLSAAARDAMRYVPALKVADFKRRKSETSGIRAQALSADGKLIDDFVFESVAEGRVLHVRNAPSPAATSSLAIARMIVDRSLQPATTE